MINIFFRYRLDRFDTNINPEVPVVDINRVPISAPSAGSNYSSCFWECKVHAIPCGTGAGGGVGGAWLQMTGTLLVTHPNDNHSLYFF